MKKYRFSDEEKKLLKIAKLNQIKSDALKEKINSLSSEMDESIESNEIFLNKIEKRMGIIHSKEDFSSCSFKRESSKAEPMEWSQLVSEANQVVDYDVSFENLLSQDDFKNAYAHLDEINETFKKKTGLRKKDFVFLGVAIALQCARQYVLDPWLKKTRAGASAFDEKGRKNNAEAGWYYASTDKILTNRVPFDVQHYGDFETIQWFLQGGDHRLMTLGHDPILGWIFGTVNIMTNTVTRNDFVSAHVKVINNENKIHSIANTAKIFEAVISRVSQRGIDGKIALGCALLREGIHLKSDIYTKRSLPLPGLSTVSPDFAQQLTKYGIDTASVGTEITLACLINLIIAIVHRLCFDGLPGEEKLYEVRTRKILLYSNLIASTSNVIASVLSKNYKLLDVGGLLVTISRLITDIRFMCKVRDEFVRSKLDEHFEGIRSETEALYNNRFNN